MKTLYLDLSMGAAGDMLTAALLELCPDREGMLQRLNGLGIPGVRFQPEQGQKLGVPGTHMAVTVHGEEEGEGHRAPPQRHGGHPQHHPGAECLPVGEGQGPGRVSPHCQGRKPGP